MKPVKMFHALTLSPLFPAPERLYMEPLYYAADADPLKAQQEL